MGPSRVAAAAAAAAAAKRAPFEKMSVVRVAEKKETNVSCKGSNVLNGTTTAEVVPEDIADWQNGQNLLVVTQDSQGKELIALADNQTISVAVDSYCSYLSTVSFFPLSFNFVL